VFHLSFLPLVGGKRDWKGTHLIQGEFLSTQFQAALKIIRLKKKLTHIILE
jgi:hypothetical protein